jgi:PHD/YefM family antitoxin component YafN of YafNO toxin-antitoxin module
MSTAVESKPLTLAQRSAAAAQQAAALVGADDVKRMGVALAEAALEGMRRNPSFAAHVRQLYDSMAAQRSVRIKDPKRTTSRVELVPIRRLDVEINPAAPPDPYLLLDLYGPEQLPLALEPYTLPRLREAVKQVQARHPGTKPHGTSKPAIIDYLVHLAIAGK